MMLHDAHTSSEVAPDAEHVDSEDILKILEKHGEDTAALVSVLGEIQAKYRCLPSDALRILADRTGCSLVDVYGAATFYRSFSLKPKGKHLVSVCLGTACHVRGAPSVAEEFQRQLSISAGETTPDKEFTLETVNCLGACALGPIIVADGQYFSNVTPAKVKQILKRTRAGLDGADLTGDQQIFPVKVGCPHCDHSLMDAEHPTSGQPSIRVVAAFDHKRGWLRLSSLYGVCAAQAEHEIPIDTMVELFCPHCDTTLLGSANCLECEAPMAQMVVRGGGVLRVCSRCGCDGQTLDLDGPDPDAGNDGYAKPIRRTSSKHG